MTYSKRSHELRRSMGAGRGGESAGELGGRGVDDNVGEEVGLRFLGDPVYWGCIEDEARPGRSEGPDFEVMSFSGDCQGDPWCSMT